MRSIGRSLLHEPANRQQICHPDPAVFIACLLCFCGAVRDQDHHHLLQVKRSHAGVNVRQASVPFHLQEMLEEQGSKKLDYPVDISLVLSLPSRLMIFRTKKRLRRYSRSKRLR